SALSARKRSLPHHRASSGAGGGRSHCGLPSPRTATRFDGRLKDTEMISFVLSRLLRAIITIFAVVTFAFIVLRMSGDPAQVMLGPDVPQDAVDAFRTAWGLDQPLWVQYIAYIQSILSGDFGYSMRDKAPAMDLVLERIPATLQLTV